ncbi:CHAT domain-containing protein [Nocardia nepalensis]|uniref:CHAT domain-containing protein n=1 Tax=Nocardia nepalensis TaxID=3375448 RepID=UPI003B6826E6
MACTIQVEIEAGSGAGEYTTHVVHSPVGAEPSATMYLDAYRLLDEQNGLETEVLASAVVGRRVAGPDEKHLQEVGGRLFKALFAGPVLRTYRESVAAAQDRGEQLHVELRMSAPELAALPWEALWDDDTKNYLCLTEPLVRHVPAPYAREPLKVTPPLRILGLVASPRGMPFLEVLDEQEHLERALVPLTSGGLLHIEWLRQASWAGVQEKLLADHWHVLHFIGHGYYDVKNDQGCIDLVGSNGGADPIGANKLANLLSLAEPTPRLVVLNSCSSGAESSMDLFSGTAAVLARSGVNAVAAMQFTISDAAAISFAAGFYTAIAHGHSVDNAVHSGRISILGAHTLEWVTPVLYLRGENSQLFTLRQRRVARGRSAPPRPRKTSEPRDAAAEKLDLADRYQRAVDAQACHKWAAATSLFDEILEARPGYRDATTRRQECRTAGQIADLQSELRRLADTGDWTAVADVSDEIARLDPAEADPDGLATRARDNLRADAELAGKTRPDTGGDTSNGHREGRRIPAWTIGIGAAAAIIAAAATAIYFVVSGQQPAVHWSAGDCARVTVDTLIPIAVPCDSIEADAEVKAIVSAPDKCNRLNGNSPVTGGYLCWDINWKEGRCFDKARYPVKQIPCSEGPGEFRVKVTSILHDTTDATKCGSSPYTSVNDIDNFVVCGQPLRSQT